MRLYSLIWLFVFTGISVISGQEPTHWRGPNANGIYPESGLLNDWPANGPAISWHYDKLGEGFSSPAFANGHIYISGMENNEGYIYILSKTGKLLHKFLYGKEFYESYPGSRSTPTIAGDLLYIVNGYGKVVCMNVNTGKINWSKDLFSDFDGKNIRWGITETLLVNDDRIYCTPGGKKNNVIALNRFNGDLIWSSPGEQELSAYCSPILINHNGRKIIVTMTASHIIGLEEKDGGLLWSHPQPNRWSVHANTPVYHDGGLACTSGYGQGTVKLVLNEDGSKIKKQWFNSSFDSRMGGAVFIDDHLYGSGDQNRYWYCIDWETGEIKYSDNEIGIGVVIAAEGMLYCYSQRGKLALVEATTEGFNIKGETKVTLGTGQHWSHPVINDGHLYLRHGKSLIAYKIK